jgi:hypothetical protein
MVGTVVALVLAFALAVSTGISLYQRVSDGHLLVIGIAIFAVCFAVLAKLFSLLGWLTGKGGEILSSRKGRVALALFVGLGVSS